MSGTWLLVLAARPTCVMEGVLLAAGCTFGRHPSYERRLRTNNARAPIVDYVDLPAACPAPPQSFDSTHLRSPPQHALRTQRCMRWWLSKDYSFQWHTKQQFARQQASDPSNKRAVRTVFGEETMFPKQRKTLPHHRTSRVPHGHHHHTCVHTAWRN